MRALAVVPVILFHAGCPGLGGGYVGVDIFFVISGYLITTLIAAERAAGTFTLAGFYERRARRLLPALMLVMACTVPFAWCWTPPDLFAEFAASLAATTLFGANLLFWHQTGYFAPAAAETPLLHSWSLGIEEQFYLLFPLLVLGLWPLGRRRLAAGLALVAGLSLAAALGGLPDASGAYYLIPARAWELLAGALLALAAAGRPPALGWGPAAAQFLAALGLGLIVGAITLLDAATPYPGPATLLPVGGAVLVLAFATPTTVVGRVLAQPWLASIGLVSYSAYLWHQPLFAFARLRSLEPPGAALYALLCLATAALAVLSWRYVERPFRRPGGITRPRFAAAAGTAAAALVALGLAGSLADGAALRLTPAERAAIEPPRSNGRDCRWQQPLPAFPGIEICRLGVAGGGHPVVILGDSHAEALLAAADAGLAARGLTGWLVHNDHCRPIVGLYRADRHGPEAVGRCERAQAALLAYLRAAAPRAVVVAMRWTFQLFPVPGQIDRLGFDNGEGGREDERPRTYVTQDATGRFVVDGAAKARTLRRFLDGLAGLGAPLVLQYPVPEVGWHVPHRNFKYLLAEGRIPATISTSAARFRARQAFVTGVLDSLVRPPAIVALKPGALLCDNALAGRCIAQRDGIPLYFDDDHLSRQGAELVIAATLALLPPGPSCGGAAGCPVAAVQEPR